MKLRLLMASVWFIVLCVVINLNLTFMSIIYIIFSGLSCVYLLFTAFVKVFKKSESCSETNHAA